MTLRTLMRMLLLMLRWAALLARFSTGGLPDALPAVAGLFRRRLRRGSCVNRGWRRAILRSGTRYRASGLDCCRRRRSVPGRIGLRDVVLLVPMLLAIGPR